VRTRGEGKKTSLRKGGTPGIAELWTHKVNKSRKKTTTGTIRGTPKGGMEERGLQEKGKKRIASEITRGLLILQRVDKTGFF